MGRCMVNSLVEVAGRQSHLHCKARYKESSPRHCSETRKRIGCNWKVLPSIGMQFAVIVWKTCCTYYCTFLDPQISPSIFTPRKSSTYSEQYFRNRGHPYTVGAWLRLPDFLLILQVYFGFERTIGSNVGSPVPKWPKRGNPTDPYTGVRHFLPGPINENRMKMAVLVAIESPW